MKISKQKTVEVITSRVTVLINKCTVPDVLQLKYHYIRAPQLPYLRTNLSLREELQINLRSMDQCYFSVFFRPIQIFSIQR